jgi:hypothetical protein
MPFPEQPQKELRALPPIGDSAERPKKSTPAEEYLSHLGDH